MIANQTVLTAANAAISDVLRPFGLSLLDNAEDVLEQIIREVYPHVDTIARGKIRRVLLLLGFPAVVAALEDKQTRSTDGVYSCDILRTQVVSTCRNVNCRWHVDKPEDYDCLRIAEQSNKGISTEMLSELMNINPLVLQDHLSVALEKMRRSSVSIAQKHAKAPLRRFTVFKTLKVCCACDADLSVTPPYYTEGGLAFCSEKCVGTEPAFYVLEAQYGLPVRELADWARKSYETIRIAAEALGYPERVLRLALKQ